MKKAAIVSDGGLFLAAKLSGEQMARQRSAMDRCLP
jgi:hypothetical protein